MMGPTMNLISGTRHSCERREHAFMVLREYTIISPQRRFDSTQLHNLIEGLDLCFGIGIGNLCIVGLVALIVKEASY